jgi:hypothetical protein
MRSRREDSEGRQVDFSVNLTGGFTKSSPVSLKSGRRE